MPPQRDPLQNAKLFINSANEYLQLPNQQIIGYYMKQYGIQQAYDVYKEQKQTNAVSGQTEMFCNQQIQELEQLKQQFANQLTDKDGNKKYIVDHALTMFYECDDQEREGLADKTTMQNFKKVSSLLEMLTLFGILEANLQEKKKYAKVKAVEIMRLLKNPEQYQQYKQAKAKEQYEKKQQQEQQNQGAQVPSFNNENSYSSANTNTQSVFNKIAKVSNLENLNFNNDNIITTQSNSNHPQFMVQSVLQGDQEQQVLDLLDFSVSELDFNKYDYARQYLQEAINKLQGM